MLSPIVYVEFMETATSRGTPLRQDCRLQICPLCIKSITARHPPQANDPGTNRGPRSQLAPSPTRLGVRVPAVLLPAVQPPPADAAHVRRQSRPGRPAPALR